MPNEFYKNPLMKLEEYLKKQKEKIKESLLYYNTASEKIREDLDNLIVHVNNADSKKTEDELEWGGNTQKNKAMITIKEEARAKKYHTKLANRDQSLLGAFIKLTDKMFFQKLIS